MQRNDYLDLIKRISRNKFGNESEINLSKALGFHFIQSYFEVEIDPYDIWISNVDASNDRGFDFIYFDDSIEDIVKVYIIQTKYSEVGNYNISENEVAKYILNFNNFPEIEGNTNPKLKEKIEDYFMYKNVEFKNLEKIGLYINLGTFSQNAKSQLEQNKIDVYDFERLNNEILLDKNLPNFTIDLKKEPLFYDENSFISIIKVDSFLNDQNVREIIKNQSIFHYNVRGLMSNRRNSISDDIKITIKDEPNKLFLRNNGLTIICDSFEEKTQLSYNLNKASIINGQQTIRAILSIWGSIDSEIKEKLFLSAKVIQINAVSDFNEILNIAKSSNKQNSIKISDLFANDSEQLDIQEKAKFLPDQLKFTYLPKRTVDLPDNLYITKDEAIVLLNLFLRVNPSDRAENLYRDNYREIFENVKPEHIIIIKKLRNKIGDKQLIQDKNNPTNKFWEDKVYSKFKKGITLNFSLYLFACLITHRFNKQTKSDRQILLDNIYNKMIQSSNFDIENYFNNHFWQSYLGTLNRFIKPLYEDNSITFDIMRKKLSEETRFYEMYDTLLSDRAIDEIFEPKILI